MLDHFENRVKHCKSGWKLSFDIVLYKAMTTFQFRFAEEQESKRSWYRVSPRHGDCCCCFIYKKKSRKEIDVNTVRRLLSRIPSIRICKAGLKVPNDCFNAFKLLAMVFFYVKSLWNQEVFFLSRVRDRLSVRSL